MRYEKKTVVITGVGREGQVGEAIAQAFAREGAALALVDLAADQVEGRATAIRTAGGRADAHAGDLTNPAEVEHIAAAVARTHSGGVDALVHVAGGFAMSGPVGDSDVAVLQRQLAINLTTAYAATRYFLPLLRARGGAIVYFASAAVLAGESAPRMSAYAAAKSGVLALMRAVAAEEVGANVRANAVAPTAIRTRDNLATMDSSTRYVDRESVADVVLFLCSEAARNISGQVLRLA